MCICFYNPCLPCCFFYFKISLYSLQTSIFREKTQEETPPPEQMQCECNTPRYCKPRLLAKKMLGYHHSRAFLLDGNPCTSDHPVLMGRPSCLWIPAAAADSHMLCSCFRLPAAKARPSTRLDQSPHPFFPSALPKHVVAGTRLSLFLKLAAF